MFIGGCVALADFRCGGLPMFIAGPGLPGEPAYKTETVVIYLEGSEGVIYMYPKISNRRASPI